MGRLVSPESIFEIAKYEKASGRNLSERFQFTSAVSLAQELGGSTLGKSIDQFEKTIVGAVNNHAALKVAASYGLINHDDIIWTKQGEAKGLKAGKQYAGGDEAQKDPDRWIWSAWRPRSRSTATRPTKRLPRQFANSFPPAVRPTSFSRRYRSASRSKTMRSFMRPQRELAPMKFTIRTH